MVGHRPGDSVVSDYEQLHLRSMEIADQQRALIDGMIAVPTIKFRRLDQRARVPMISYAGDMGFDLYNIESHVWQPGDVLDVPTGIAIQLPAGFGARIVGRSSTIRKRGLLVVEGIIDNGWRGHLFFAVLNPGDTPVQVSPGDRLAQLIPQRLHSFSWMEVEQLDGHERGENGFGSTGT